MKAASTHGKCGLFSTIKSQINIIININVSVNCILGVHPAKTTLEDKHSSMK